MDQNGRFMALVSGKIYRKPWFLPSNLMGRPIGLSGENCPILKKVYDSWHWLYQKQISSNDMKPV